MDLKIKPKAECRFDVISLGEVMLRFDPGDRRIHDARSFHVCEGGGEYNAARSIAKNFRLNASVVTALADNQVGRLVEDLMSESRVDTSNILWSEADGISREVRNGVYFIERGFGLRAPTAVSDRGNTAVSKLKPGEVDWKKVLDETRWFHTGGIFAGLSDTTPAVAHEAMQAARDSGAIVSYDLNYRDSLWAGRGGRDAADRVNNDLLKFADVVFGVTDFDARLSEYSEDSLRNSASKMVAAFPNLQLVVTTLRNVRSASCHDIGGVAFGDGQVAKARDLLNVDVLDRVGSGDAFAAGVIYGLLRELPIETGLNLGVANAAYALASVGDGSAATLNEIERLAAGGGSNVRR
jgi:2-dehydro-3-deoxygluconokinase